MNLSFLIRRNSDLLPLRMVVRVAWDVRCEVFSSTVPATLKEFHKKYLLLLLLPVALQQQQH